LLQVLNLVRQYEWMLRQHSACQSTWQRGTTAIPSIGRKHELANLLYAHQLLQALNLGDPRKRPTGARSISSRLHGRRRAKASGLAQRLANAYTALETADSFSALAR